MLSANFLIFDLKINYFNSIQFSPPEELSEMSDKLSPLPKEEYFFVKIIFARLRELLQMKFLV